jgi:glycosyltransferase involved in cell wall biosynthesis
MKIALIAPPFISVPPTDYGGTELFVAHLAEALQKSGVEVVVYTNGESTVNVERRWIFEHSQWPIKSPEHAWIKQLNHESWAVHDAVKDCRILHVQSPQALAMSRFVGHPTILTLHGPHNSALSELYRYFPNIYYVSISDFQGRQESMPRIRTIHHGIDVSQYRFVAQKQQYLSFIGRIAPIKGVHLAIDVARRTGIPLKIAGDLQPIYREYFENKIKPQIDGSLVEYIGLANAEVKNELLGNSMAMLFPIQWNEPFGLVMVEAMACGTPVLAMPGGSVPEVVHDGISGYICHNVREMTNRVKNLQIDPATIRRYVEENFSIERMVRGYMELYEDVIQNHNSERAA